MKYFTLQELTHSSTATNRGLKNIPTPEQEKNICALVDNVLDPLREAYGSPIYVNSGFRSNVLNITVGGVPTSHHKCENGYAAADLDTRGREGNRQIFKLAQELNLPFCQLIDECDGSWIHISYHPTDIRRQVLYK